MTEPDRDDAAAPDPAVGEPGPEIVPPEPAPRRYPSTVGGLLYLVALAGILVGLGIVVMSDWRFGVRFMAGSLLFAAACRLVMPTRQAGMLAVRHRMIDVVMLVGVSAALAFLAGSIPNQPS